MSDDSSTDRISVRVVETIAADRGVDPIELTPLYDAVDPDALDSLFRNGNTVKSVTFTYERTPVTVTADGRVTVGRAADGGS